MASKEVKDKFLVTGATGGIGFEIAKELYNAGHGYF